MEINLVVVVDFLQRYVYLFMTVLNNLKNRVKFFFNSLCAVRKTVNGGTFLIKDTVTDLILEFNN